MTVVYLAGKMGSGNGACDCDYRHKRPHEWAEHDHGCRSIFSEGNWRHDILEGTQPTLEQLRPSAADTYGGPWFIDRSNHGLEIEHVADRRLSWVRKSDAVFAWIGAL